MKQKVFILLFMVVGLNAFAQHKTNTSNLLGFSVGINKPSTISIPKYKIGLPTFSYSTSIERRLIINNKLQFSLQYSLNYYNYNQRLLNETFLKQKTVATTLGVTTHFNTTKKSSVYAGIGIEKNIFESKKILNSESYISNTSNKFTLNDFNKMNPYFLIGIENGIQLLNINMIYSLQYNFGFNTSKFKLLEPENPSSGFKIGLKYKY